MFVEVFQQKYDILMTKDEILQKKMHGDLKTAGAMLGITEKNAYAALTREGSKYHNRIVACLSKVIKMREMLQKESKTEAYENA